MKVKLITENDEAVSAVISCNPEELLIINKALSRAYADESFGERSRNVAKQMGEDCKHFEQVEVAEQTEPSNSEKPNNCEDEPTGYNLTPVEDEPQTDCAWSKGE